MQPVLFQIGPFPVSSFGLFLLLAFVVAVWLAARAGREVGIDPNEIVDLGLYVIIGGLVGARIGHVLVNLQEFSADPVRIVRIWQDAGLNFYGALVGGAWVVWVYAMRRGWRTTALLDLIAPPVAAGYAVAMIGALLYGLNVGRPASVPWAVMIFGEPRHPTQLYLALASLGIYRVLTRIREAKRYSGQVFVAYLFLYGVVRFVVEFFMQPEPSSMIGPLSLAQVAGAALVLVSLALMALLGRRSNAADEWPALAEPAPEPGGERTGV